MNKITELHIEPTNICTLKCPGCARTQFINKFPAAWKNHSLNIDQLDRFIDIDLSNVYLVLGGVYGDPIYHPDFHDFVKRFKSRNAGIKITTNGSYHKRDWWEKLVNLLGPEDYIMFSVDGIPDNFTQYRINGNWDSIKLGMQIAANSPVNTIWKYIPFKFNQHNIEQARQLSQDLGIDEFNVELSSRFDNDTEYLIPVDDLVKIDKKNQDQFKQGIKNTKLDPKCSQGNRHYISADGYYSPCCFIADHRFYYKTQFGKSRTEYSIKDTTLLTILEKPSVVTFYSTLDSALPGVCQYNCSAVN